MSVFEDPEWWPLIDREAAIAEQFPPIEKVRLERPGGKLAQRLDAEHQARKNDPTRSARLRSEMVAKNADEFIRMMRAKESEAEAIARLDALNRERREAERALRAAHRRLSWLNATAMKLESSHREAV